MDHSCAEDEGILDERTFSRIEREALERQLKLGKGHEHVLMLISNCARSRSKYLDLARKNISILPIELLSLNHIENLYLEGNQIEALPEDFFHKLTSLRWLDLRNNHLRSIPSAYIGSHKCLTNLLLQGNNIQTLPLELGCVDSLQGLNISNNPLRFPPSQIIGKGVRAILSYLHEMLISKSNGSFKSGVFANGAAGDSRDPSESNSDEEVFGGSRTSTQQRPRLQRPSSAKSDASEITGKTLSLHKQQSYQELRQHKMAKVKNAGASGVIQRKTNLSKIKDVNLFPEPPSASLIDVKVREQLKMAAARENNEKIDEILQRRKDEDRLSQFREEAKVLQRKKEREKLLNGGKLDYAEPARGAPYDISEEDMRMIDNEERIKRGVKENHERIRHILSPRAIKEQELERLGQEKLLSEKIQDHTNSMKTRRKKPKGTPQEEMEAAIRELEIAKRLQQELDRRQRELQYRFRAYNPPP